jgi:hypothetical protein
MSGNTAITPIATRRAHIIAIAIVIPATGILRRYSRHLRRVIACARTADARRTDAKRLEFAPSSRLVHMAVIQP